MHRIVTNLPTAWNNIL